MITVLMPLYTITVTRVCLQLEIDELNEEIKGSSFDAEYAIK